MKKIASIAALAVTAALAAPAAGQAASFDTSKSYRITTSWSLALEISGASRGDGAPLDQWPVNGGSHQHWRFDQVGANYRIRNVNSNKCITAPGGSTAPRTKLVQWTCGRAGQEWQLAQTSFFGQPTNLYAINVPGVDARIDIPEGTPYWGTQLQLWPRIGSPSSQSFVLTPID